ncbi:MAG: hypothetical protein IT276_16890 [Ignavibacteriaceae bacterium]|nr:hypothetical protein [Ignavibacteriaceae bacterium]HRQ54022.1 hypothetical protein [Ignavibacteriaceae bacterium]
MIKFTCFTDTCSYINLTVFEYKDGTLLDLLRKKANVKISPDINRVEIPKHSKDRVPKTSERINEVYHPKHFDYLVYEEKLFNSKSKAGDSDKGEKDNFSGLIHHYFSQKTKGLIYLTDDFKAINNSLVKPGFAFPIFRFWSSFDVVLFLYIDNVIISKDIAENALRALNANIAVDDIKMSKSKTELRLDRLNKYLSYLELIYNLKS